MNCPRVQTWIQLYVDGRLGLAQLARLEDHLASCLACRAELDHLEAIRRVVEAPCGGPEPEVLTSAVMARIALVEQRRAAAAVAREPARGRVGLAPGVTVGWGDALVAALLATLATALLLILQPQIGHPVALVLGQAVEDVRRGWMATIGNSPAWLAWVVWVGMGVLLALAFAGAEVRAGWRRNLMARLPH